MKKYPTESESTPDDDVAMPPDGGDESTDGTDDLELGSAESSGGANAEAATGAAGAGAVNAGAEQEITALAKEVAVQKDKYLRMLAEYENFRKRAVRDRQEAEHKGMGFLIKGILDTLDDLGRFAHLDPDSTDTKTVVEGVELIERKLLKSLAGHGLELVNPVDEPFDPTFQEALTTVPAATEEEDNFVAQVYQVGYVFNGQLLRPARVVVKQWQGGDAGNTN